VITPILTDISLIEALTSKKTSLQSQISSLKLEIIHLSNGLSHLNATINLLKGDFVVVKEKRIVHRHFKPNECKTSVLDLLRTSSSPLDTKTISIAMATKANAPIKEEELRFFQKSILNTLKALEKKELIRTVGKEGLALLWEIA
jgi:hypothetical protein